MSTQQSIAPLLESLVQDNETYKFPIESINKELTNMFLEPLEFDYFLMQAFRKLKREYGTTIAHIFISTLELKLKTRERDIYTLTETQYQIEMESFLSTLENLLITKIEKNSPDGEMLTAMI